MPQRPLPNDPSFEHLRKEAKRLRKAVASSDAEALALVREFHPRGDEAIVGFGLAAAQLVTARSYGFASWTRLKQHLAIIEPHVWNPPAPPSEATPLVERFIRLACLVYGGWHRSNQAKARRLLTEHPELAHADVSAAAAAGDIATVRAAIERDPEVVNAKGGPLRWEPLLYTCYSRMDGHDEHRSTVEVARLLLSHGADPNAGFLWGGTYPFTALTGAFGRGEDNMNLLPHPQCGALARLLLEAGADPNDSQALYNRHFEENDDHLVLLFAYGLGQDKQGPWLKRLGDRLMSPAAMLVQELCWAAIHGFARRVELLVDHGVDVNARSGRNGRTPYEEALRAGNRTIADDLLQRGATKVELDPLETFALACIAGRREEARARLTDAPALLAKLGRAGQVELLHRAVEAKSLAGVRLIAELGVDVNGMVPGTGWDRSPLHNAAAWGTLEMVELLLELGADPQLRDLAYHSAPIGWAAYGQQQQILEYLMRFANVFDAVRCGGVERAAQLLQQDPSLANATDEDGDPLAFYLGPELARLEEIIGVLTAHGVDLNARNRAGRTLLGRALAHGFSDFADLLRAHGARDRID